MDTYEVDISHLKKFEEDITIAFVDYLMEEDFEERYHPDEFDPDEIFMVVTLHGDVIFEYGKVDDEAYVSVIPYKLQYYGDDTRLNIINEFKSIFEEYQHG